VYPSRVVAVCLMIFSVYIDVLLIIEEKIFVLIEWSYGLNLVDYCI
jgi:hypothetical protein